MSDTLIEQRDDFTLILKPQEHRVDFVVVLIMTRGWKQQSHDGDWEEYPIGYQRKDSSLEPDLIADPLEAEPYIEGSVKWDGCINYQVGIDNVMMHGCDENDLRKVSKALLAVYRRCGEILIANGKADANAFEEIRLSTADHQPS